MKPQFELEEPDEEFDGVIRDPELILEIAAKVMAEMADEGAYVRNAALSPVTGRKGNQELLFDISSDPGEAAPSELLIERLRLEFSRS
jgi:predicted rRNA methylase YqxC with S4 and FtsJ domains